jgi:hypothetical protein
MATKTKRRKSGRPVKRLRRTASKARRKPARKNRFTERLSTFALFPSPVGPPQPFTKAASSSNGTLGSSTTTGLRGTLQKYDDGSVVIEASESMTAFIPADGSTPDWNGSLTGSCRRVQQGNITTVHQLNYSYRGRVLSDSTLLNGVTDFSSLPVPAGFDAVTPDTDSVIATQFGKGDDQDNGTGSPYMGLVQTDSEVFGGSVKISIMETVFGNNWDTNDKRLGAMIDILFAKIKRMIRVPLVDVGPGEKASSHAHVDLTWASDQFLGTQGNASIQYRILVPS